MDRTITIGGAAGQGIQTIGATLAGALSRSGRHVFAWQDYESRVRGGHNFYSIRFSDDRVLAPLRRIDLLIALDPESVSRHSTDIQAKGHAIYDSTAGSGTVTDARFVDVPFRELAVSSGGGEVMANSAAIGAAMGILGMGAGELETVFTESLGRKGEETVLKNVAVAKAGLEHAERSCPGCAFDLPAGGVGLALVEGNEAIARAAIAAGCHFYAAYPMTPSTGILDYMAAHQEEYSLVAEQAEDEIAAVNMALGASFAGVRAMTGTSGGGFALMVEGLSLAGMTETPVVMVLAQRPGPATGFPTRTEQADLLFALYAGHGEFARVLLAPGTPEQAFRAVGRAFELAEKYQVPSIILTDQHYADSQWSVSDGELERPAPVDYRLRGERLRGLERYRRHELTETGVSPLAVPGASEHLVVTDSDEHDEDGHITEDARIRKSMVEKRLYRKLALLSEEMGPPLVYGSEQPEVVLAGWGSNYGVMKEAVDALDDGLEVAMLHFSELYPFPAARWAAQLGILSSARLSVCVENNASGRFATHLHTQTGIEFDTHVRKYDGRPFTLEELMEELDGLIGGL